MLRVAFVRGPRLLLTTCLDFLLYYPDVFGLSSYKALYFIHFIDLLINDRKTKVCMGNLYNPAK